MPADLAGDGEVTSAPCWNCGKQQNIPKADQPHIDRANPFTTQLQDDLRDWATRQCGCGPPEDERTEP